MSLITSYGPITHAITDPILALKPLVWLDRDGIDASATTAGNNVNTWTCKITGTVFNKVGTTQPTLEVNASKRAVLFNGTSALYITNATCTTLGINFRPTVDQFSIVVMIGNDNGSSGTLVGKQANGADEIQYQVNYHVVSGGDFSTTFGRNGATPNAFRPIQGPIPLPANEVVTATASTTEVHTYFGTTTYDTPSTDVGTTGPDIPLADVVNTHPLFIGARRNNADTSVGFQFEGSIAHVLFFNKVLTTDQISTLKTNLI